MSLKPFVLRILDEIAVEVRMSLNGMELEQVMWRPSPESNSMAWLAWHIARLQDARAAAVAKQEQLWVSDEWHARFGLPPDPANNGRGHSDQDVVTVQPDSVDALGDYANAAHVYLKSEVERLEDLSSGAAVSGDSGDATKGELTFRVVHGGLAHAGQLMYVRGLVEKRHWFPR